MLVVVVIIYIFALTEVKIDVEEYVIVVVKHTVVFVVELHQGNA